MTTDTTTYVTPDEFAQMLRIPAERVRERLRAGDLPHVRLPGSRLYRIPLEDALAACYQPATKQPSKHLRRAATSSDADERALMKELFSY